MTGERKAVRSTIGNRGERGRRVKIKSENKTKKEKPKEANDAVPRDIVNLNTNTGHYKTCCGHKKTEYGILLGIFTRLREHIAELAIISLNS